MLLFGIFGFDLVGIGFCCCPYWFQWIFTHHITFERGNLIRKSMKFACAKVILCYASAWFRDCLLCGTDILIMILRQSFIQFSHCLHYVELLLLLRLLLANFKGFQRNFSFICIYEFPLGIIEFDTAIYIRLLSVLFSFSFSGNGLLRYRSVIFKIIFFFQLQLAT